MQIKQFTGSTVDEILKQIRAELGDEAVILQTRRIVRGGIGGFFGREIIEVTAAEGVDDEAARERAGEDNRAAMQSVLDVRDEDDDLPNPFAKALQSRMSAATEVEADPYAEAMRPAVGAPAAPVNVYARNALDDAQAPFAPAGPERTQAIIEAAREAMRQARVAREEQAAITAAPAMPPAPPEFIPARTTTTTSRGGMQVMPDTDDPGVSLPVWERVGADVEEELEPEFESAPVVRQEPAPAPRRAPRRAAAPPPPPVAEEDEVEEFEDDLEPLAMEEPAPAPARPARTRQAPAVETAAPGKALEAIRGELLGVGVDARYLDPFLDGFARTALPFIEGDNLREAVRMWIGSRLPVPREWKGRPANQMLAFVGQSGVGKSTVVAKLAWRLHAAGQSVAVISAGGPMDAHLEAVAQRLGLAVAVAEDADSLVEARGDLAGHDVILVDTPGRSHKNLGDMEELGRLLSPAKAEEVHLVLPVAVHLADLGDVSRRFRLAGVNRLTITKLDETRFLGNLVNVPMRMAKPLAFLADGPGVPDDLSPADPMHVAELLLS